MESEPLQLEKCVDLNHYRKLVRTNVDMRRYKTALYWADKAATFSKHEPKDVYWKAHCMFLLGEYHRAVHTIRFRGLEKTNIFCHYLVAECLLEAKEYQQAIELLNANEADNVSTSMQQFDSMEFESTEPGDPTKAELLSAIWLLKGKVLEAMDNRQLAMDAYIQALNFNVYCTEAMDALTQHEMLMSGEERTLIEQLPFRKQCTDFETRVIKLLYMGKLKKYYETDTIYTHGNRSPYMQLATLQSIRAMTNRVPSETREEFRFDRRPPKLLTPSVVNLHTPAAKILNDLRSTPNFGMANIFQPQESIKTQFIRKTLVNPIQITGIDVNQSLDMQISKAENLFYTGEYTKCMAMLEEPLKEDPYHPAGLVLQIGCLVEMKKTHDLFYLAHTLVDLYPNKAIAWYAVGCYYDMINKSDPARRYLSKATSLDRLFGPAWLAYGHSFAKENEHDQAMAAYFKATQLMRGCHLPLLYIGVESGLTKNHELAEEFFYQAMAIAPLDVYVMHELGVIKYEHETYTRAEEVLRTTYEIVSKMAKKNREAIPVRWEPLLNNLGHCCRKNHKYEEALSFHQQALVLKPQSASTYTAIGLCQAMMWRLSDAIETLHRSLAIRRDDTVTATLLRNCIEDLMEENAVPDSILDLNPPGMSSYEEASGSDAASGHMLPETETPIMKLKLTFDDSTGSAASKTINSSLEMSM